MTEYVIVDSGGNVVKSGYESEAEAKGRASEMTNSFVHSGIHNVEEVEKEETGISPVLFNGHDENSAENDDDNQTSMSNYDFLTTDDEQTETTNDFDVMGNKWTLGDHTTSTGNSRDELANSINETIKSLDDDIDGDMLDVLQDASVAVSESKVTRFECPVEACGLGHSHSDHKHDIRSGFDVLNEFASQMKFTPYCHCGVNELSMLMDFFPYISEPVFENQHEFEGVLEVDPDVLESLYRLYSGEDLSVNAAIREVAKEYSLPKTSLVPMDVRSDIKQFFNIRSDIDSAASSAPIAQETRGVIAQNRESLEAVTSE